MKFIKQMSRPDGSLRFVNLEYHPSDSRIRIVDYDVAQTINGRMGTGGGNVPLILEIRCDDDAVLRAEPPPVGREDVLAAVPELFLPD